MLKRSLFTCVHSSGPFANDDVHSGWCNFRLKVGEGKMKLSVCCSLYCSGPKVAAVRDDWTCSIINDVKSRDEPVKVQLAIWPFVLT